MSLADDTSLGAATAVAPMLAAAAIEPLIGGQLPVRLIAWDGSIAGPSGAPVVWVRSAAESFIAPDMNMRPLGQTIALLEEAGLCTIAVEAMREHYVRTVDTWIDNLETRWDAVVGLIGEEAARVWRLYLAGGRLAFAQGRMGVDQILLSRPTTVATA